jgi:hypothetical protein
LRSIGTGSTSAGSDHVTVNVPAGVQPGDAMIAQIAVRGGTGTTITLPAGWTLLLRTNRAGSIGQAVYRRIVPPSPAEPATYTWNFTAGNDAAGGIAAYSGVSQVTPVDASGGQGNASSTSITSPSITVPAGHTADKLLGLFTVTTNAITVPAGTTQQWSFHAVGFGITIAMSDKPLIAAGATGTLVATAGTKGANVGQQVALTPGP